MSRVKGGGILEEAQSGIPECGEFCCLSTSRASVSWSDSPHWKVAGGGGFQRLRYTQPPGLRWAWGWAAILRPRPTRFELPGLPLTLPAAEGLRGGPGALGPGQGWAGHLESA